ncbi:growth-regulated protein homolog gamma-like isoform X3 [Pipistrellus kuhlii]|uniref:growth-regulated protein homolog gamma-like isoform X3 n=1 Tax=Pipistrellus kuhlii TaxID=59472 RepID=UPI00174F6082|nr:growth-regulated protein homolog gamma-like isoform X3 [Pipistrellus kuhlii]
MARTATAASAPRAPGLLRAALLLLLLVAACRQTAAAPVASELRCLCLENLDRIHPKYIQSVKVTSPGPYCDKTEVIASLKNGQKVCLNPASPLVKMILDKLLKK